MFTVAIQAGGYSSRMGSNKALMPFLDKPLITRIVNRLAPMADEIFVVSNQPGLFDFLGIPVHPDILPGLGPLGGLLAALSYAQQPIVGNFACDMPFVNPELVKAQCELLMREEADVVIPWVGQQFEPMHAVYRKDTCLPHVHTAINEGATRMVAWFHKVRVHSMTEAEILQLDPQSQSFTNVNTPEEFIQAENLARKMELRS
jgi:molybdenum cofactor guanylyltransferase